MPLYIEHLESIDCSGTLFPKPFMLAVFITETMLFN